MSVPGRLAIVLHGPPGSGKSKISDALIEQCAKNQMVSGHVSLDDGWGDDLNHPDNWRHKEAASGGDPYSDLVGRNSDHVLIV